MPWSASAGLRAVRATPSGVAIAAFHGLCTVAVSTPKSTTLRSNRLVLSAAPNSTAATSSASHPSRRQHGGRGRWTSGAEPPREQRRCARVLQPPHTPAHMAGPHLSNVVPIFNAARVLEASLARLCAGLEAFGEEFEVVCVDDGSRDGSAEIL